MKRLSSRLRSVLSDVRKRLHSQNRTKASKEDPSNLEQEQPLPSPSVDNWVKQSRFRSPIRLSGSSVIYIWFESLQETGVRFSLDMATGILSHRENWSPDIKMPGADAIDPEPLSVWGIDSADGRINIIMHVDRFDALFVDNLPSDIDSHPSVSAVLNEISNVVVRDLWIEPPS